MSTTVFGITWYASEYAWAIVIFLSAIALVWYRCSKKLRALSALTKLQGPHRPLLHASRMRIYGSAFLISIALCALYIALLRPQWHKKDTVVAQEGRDVIVGLDVSRSMLAQDCSPNRLAYAKQKIHNLVDALSCERVGLLLFSGDATMLCPLTNDYSAFYLFLDQVDVETISSGTTAFDKAIAKAAEAFIRADTKKNKLLILYTDGEDFSDNSSHIHDILRSSGMNVFAMGVGTVEGSPIPVYDKHGQQQGHLKDNDNKVVISKLNESLLAELAKKSGGVYMHTTSDNRDIKATVATISALEKEKREDKTVTAYQEQYHWFVAVAGISLLLEWLL